MLNIIILSLIFIGLIIHRYLTTFWEQGALPYPAGFTTFANLFVLIYLVNFVWMLGFLAGIIVSLLVFFQFIYGSYLWIFLLPYLINAHKKRAFPQANLNIYGLWSFVIAGLGIATIINFFVSDYMSLLHSIGGIFNNNYNLFWLLLIATMAIGSIIRSYLLSKLIKP